MSQMQASVRDPSANLRATPQKVRRLWRRGAPSSVGSAVHPEGWRVVRHRLPVGITEEGVAVREVVGEDDGQARRQAGGQARGEAGREEREHYDFFLAGCTSLAGTAGAEEVRLTTTGVPG